MKWLVSPGPGQYPLANLIPQWPAEAWNLLHIVLDPTGPTRGHHFHLQQGLIKALLRMVPESWSYSASNNLMAPTAVPCQGDCRRPLGHRHHYGTTLTQDKRRRLLPGHFPLPLSYSMISSQNPWTDWGSFLQPTRRHTIIYPHMQIFPQNTFFLMMIFRIFQRLPISFYKSKCFCWLCMSPHFGLFHFSNIKSN